MKMRGEHFQSIKKAANQTLASMDARARERGYRSAAHFYADGGLTYKRFRWDVFHASRWMKGEDFQPNGPSGMRGNIGAIYEYCNDTHIDTALKNIVDGKEWSDQKAV